MRGATKAGGKEDGTILRSIGAIAAGAAVAIVFSIASDVAMQAMGLLPRPGSAPPTDGPLLIATIYRTLYGVLAAYLMARLAPHSPLLHALIGGAIGLLVCIIGAAATWNGQYGPHWYPLALILLAMPQAWLGGRLGAASQGAGAKSRQLPPL